MQARSGCELWIHPRLEHLTASEGYPGGRKGLSGPLEPARDLLPGVEVQTDLGAWQVIETPGHAPSHVVLHQPEHRLLLSGDHVLGRVSLYFDHGWTPDPVAEYLEALDRVEPLDVRLTLSGHGRPFTDLRGHVAAGRALVDERLAAVLAALEARGEATASELLPDVYGELLTPATAGWLLTKTHCYLEHLAAGGAARRSGGCAGALAPILIRMRIDERIASGSEPSFSFEFFPPKTDEGERNLGRALAELSRLSPTFVSVTYGAGGSVTERRKTIDIVAHLKRDYGMESMAHFTCVGATTDELRDDARHDARRRRGERPRPARRPAAGRDGVDARPRAGCATPAS